MQKLIMTIGLPGSGKTTYINEFYQLVNAGTLPDARTLAYLSSDYYIECEAARLNKNYNEVFNDKIKEATANLEKNLQAALSMKQSILWDQTNLSVKSRKGKLNKIPDDYRRIALYFVPNIDRVLEINTERYKFGRDLPEGILKNMINSIQEPTFDEGFDTIIKVERQ